MLRIEGLVAGYGRTVVLRDVDLQVGAAEIVALVGMNGAGKSTLLKTVSGIVRPMAGSIVFMERLLNGLAPAQVVALGIAHVPEGRRLFGGLTVRENLLMGAYTRVDRGEVRAQLERVWSYFPILRERQRQLAGKLSGGEQQMCSIARGLMAKPRLLMIDELSLGLAPLAIERLLPTLREINRDGVSILLLDQDVQTALELAHRGYVLETGRITMEGGSAALLGSSDVRAKYLGI
ncbi:MAG: ABC transporter ATP-binding protein [Candidatus Rokubacteria bacterium]|nr:ABC transporter ATP-binding protein [Candidatus Rokubacteria bacterium]